MVLDLFFLTDNSLACTRLPPTTLGKIRKIIFSRRRSLIIAPERMDQLFHLAAHRYAAAGVVVDEDRK